MAILKSKVLWILFTIILLIIVVASFLPTPIDMDLEKIGQRERTVVFVYDPNVAASNRQTVEMNKARQLVGDQAIFLLATTGDPRGEALKKRYKAQSLDLLFFSGEGVLIERSAAVLSAEVLAQKLTTQ